MCELRLVSLFRLPDAIKILILQAFSLFSYVTALLAASLLCFTLIAYPYGIPQLLAAAVVIVLHIWKRNNLLSISAGTITYMLLIQIVF